MIRDFRIRNSSDVLRQRVVKRVQVRCWLRLLELRLRVHVLLTRLLLHELRLDLWFYVRR